MTSDVACIHLCSGWLCGPHAEAGGHAPSKSETGRYAVYVRPARACGEPATGRSGTGSEPPGPASADREISGSEGGGGEARSGAATAAVDDDVDGAAVRAYGDRTANLDAFGHLLPAQGASGDLGGNGERLRRRGRHAFRSSGQVEAAAVRADRRRKHIFHFEVRIDEKTDPFCPTGQRAVGDSEIAGIPARALVRPGLAPVTKTRRPFRLTATELAKSCPLARP